MRRGGKSGKGGKRVQRGRKVGRRAVRSKYEVKEIASLTEVTPALTLSTNQNYSAYNISLAPFSRALNVAKGYQFYRIKRVTYVIKPLLDTFSLPGGATPNNTVPYLYYMIDRVKQFVNGFTTDQIKAMGAKARRLDEKTLVFSFTPSVLTDTYDNTPGANAAVQYRMAPWLPTRDTSQVGVWNPNTTDHTGIVWRVEQAIGTPIGYSVERRVQFEFKKPSIPTTAQALEDVPIDHDTLLPQPALEAPLISA